MFDFPLSNLTYQAILPSGFLCLLYFWSNRSESVWIRSGSQAFLCTRDRFSLVERVSGDPQRSRFRRRVSENASRYFVPSFFARSPSVELHTEKANSNRIDTTEIRSVFIAFVVSNLFAERVSTIAASHGASAALSRSHQGTLSHWNARANGERRCSMAGRNEVHEDQESDEQNLRNQTKTSMAKRRAVLSIHRFGEGGELLPKTTAWIDDCGRRLSENARGQTRRERNGGDSVFYGHLSTGTVQIFVSYRWKWV